MFVLMLNNVPRNLYFFNTPVQMLVKTLNLAYFYISIRPHVPLKLHRKGLERWLSSKKLGRKKIKNKMYRNDSHVSEYSNLF